MELPAGTGAMFARGLKRKCVDPEEAVEGALAGFRAVPSYSLQRQSLLDMSLVKLQLCHMLVGPNLCRSVLIANTVRQIQEEMSRDGAWHGPAPPCTGRAPLDHLVSTEILCRAGPEPPRDSASSPPGHRGFQRSLEQVLETLEGRGPGGVEELFSDVGARGGRAGHRDGLEGLAPGPPPPGPSCKPDLGELDHVVEILVET